mmetsp:Transcript_4721/g.8691  ORF Transcript_4721/g.8691 Transcript_4721/m.8691 type:complete len:229 (+) Transcript_4721:2618-3304(+)
MILLIQVTKVSRRTVIELSTNITTPTTSVFKPRYECVNVGATPLATNNSSVSWLNNVYFVFFTRSRSKRTNNSSNRHFALSRHASCLRNLVGGKQTKAFRNLNRKVYIFLKRSSHSTTSSNGSRLHLRSSRLLRIKGRRGSLRVKLTRLLPWSRWLHSSWRRRRLMTKLRRWLHHHLRSRTGCMRRRRLHHLRRPSWSTWRRRARSEHCWTFRGSWLACRSNRRRWCK